MTKRPRSQRASSSTEVHKFANDDAEARYNESISRNQKPIEERGFVGSDLPTYVMENIAQRGWERFVQ